MMVCAPVHGLGRDSPWLGTAVLCPREQGSIGSRNRGGGW